jgi:hypothetical protein
VSRRPSRASFRFAPYPKRGQSHTRDPCAELLQRTAPRDGLGQISGQFIDFVVHNVVTFGL